MSKCGVSVVIAGVLIGGLLFPSEAHADRVWSSWFVPEQVTLADNHLQITMPTAITATTCVGRVAAVVWTDAHAKGWLSMAVSAFLSGKRLRIRVDSAVCVGTPGWPEINTMTLGQ